jgi:hypothetical protein
MRVGDFGVEVIPHGRGRVRELDSGHVLARAGQVYRLRLRNFGPLYCVADVDIDGRRVTAGGLVLEPWGTTELERPVDAHEDGRFTVVAEGSEAVFGPDGGRDNAELGLITARFRRELPRHGRRDDVPTVYSPSAPARPVPGVPRLPLPSRFPTPPEWAPPLNRAELAPMREVPDVVYERVSPIERAAGTGLTGHSEQQFVPIELGPLETEATLIQLRLVIGREEALDDAPRPLVERHAPARPAARP